MTNNSGPFKKLYNLKIYQIKNNNQDSSILYTNGTNVLSKGFYRWYFVNYVYYDCIFTPENLIVIEILYSQILRLL